MPRLGGSLSADEPLNRATNKAASVTTSDDTEDPVPTRPRRRTAPGTHPVELQRLALQERTHPDCEPLQVQTVIWLLRAAGAVLNAQADELRPLGVSPSGFNVMMALLNTPGHTLEPRDLSDRLLVSRPSVTGLLDTLQSKGFITRRTHAQDRRRVLVALTDTGRALLEQHFCTHYAEQKALLAALSPDEQATLVTLLRRIRGALPQSLEE